MKAPLYNQQGEKIDEVPLPKEVFGVPLNPDLVHQVAVSQMANQRRPIAHTKHRGEVSGGGRKPWAQKGTGRARHGSIRSPLWRHGGVVFGPRSERVFAKKINEKMRRAALVQVLSEKARNNLCIVVEDLSLEKPKTKFAAELLNKILPEKKRTLLVLSPEDKTMMRGARNIPFVEAMEVKNLNALALLQTKFLVMPKDCLEMLKKM